VFLLRLVGILVVVAVGSAFALFLVTGSRKYLKFAQQILKWAIVMALLVFALLALERLAVVV